MIDIALLRNDPDLVRENIRRKYQDQRLPLVDQALELDKLNREAILRADTLRAQRNSLSKEIGGLMQKGKKEEAEAIKQQVRDLQRAPQPSDRLAVKGPSRALLGVDPRL